MNLGESLTVAIRALSANKVRTTLTMLGVIIGVAAVILLVAIGSGVQDEVTGTIEGLGSNLVFVLPGNMEEGSGGPAAVSITMFSMEDADFLRRRLGPENLVVPIVQAPVTLRVGNRSMRSAVAAANEHAGEVFASDFEGGRDYRRSEVTAGSRVVVLGSSVRDELFPFQDPVGREIDINGQRFTVIGHLAAQGGTLTGDQDNQLYMPITAAQRLLGTEDVNSIIVKAAEADQVELVQAQVQRLLRPSFGEEFSVFTQEQTLGIMASLLGTLTVMLAGIAGISLLVGGIGIMNIMLVSVTERTREIGIRKAVGAKTYDIMSQFVIEALLISVIGGAVGMALGWAGAAALQAFVPTQVTAWAVALAFFFSAGIGVFFGVYPAYRASRLKPIVALRYE
ncbi:MAG: ABC transporter permease [Actinobacteria bacterium]|nr:ABC transporter permease [Actinomycetota bacterium]